MGDSVMKRADKLRAQSVEEQARKEQAAEDRKLGIYFEMFKLIKENNTINGVKVEGPAIAKEALKTLKEFGYE